MNMVYNTLLNQLNMKVASLPELKQYQVLMLCNNIVDTMSVTKDFTDKEIKYNEILNVLEETHPKVMDEVFKKTV